MRKSVSNAIYDIQYHFVWIPKYRKRVLINEVKKRLDELLHGIDTYYDALDYLEDLLSEKIKFCWY